MQMTAPLAQASMEERIFMTNIVKNEIRRQQANTRAASERAKQIEHSRNELLARDLEARKAQEAKRPCFADRVCDKIVRAYSVVYAIVYLIADKLVKVDEEK